MLLMPEIRKNNCYTESGSRTNAQNSNFILEFVKLLKLM